MTAGGLWIRERQEKRVGMKNQTAAAAVGQDCGVVIGWNGCIQDPLRGRMQCKKPGQQAGGKAPFHKV